MVKGDAIGRWSPTIISSSLVPRRNDGDKKTSNRPLLSGWTRLSNGSEHWLQLV